MRALRRVARALAIRVLAAELAERQGRARLAANAEYKGQASGNARRSRVFWNGYERALAALRESSYEL